MSPTQNVLLINRGRSAGVALGDRVVLDDGRQVVAAGEVFYVETGSAGVRFHAGSERPAPGRRAIVISGLVPRQEPVDLPPGVQRVARVDNVLPAGDSAWLAAGQAQGWEVGDAVRIERGRDQVTDGRVVIADTNAALAVFIAHGGRRSGPRAGDTVLQFKPEDLLRQTQLTVESVGSLEGDPLVRLAGAADPPLGDEARFDLFRGDEYVGFARVTRVEPAVEAEVWKSLSRLDPQPGDRAVLRAARTAPGIRTGWLFRVEGDYALVTIGEEDGLELGDRLYSELADGRRLPLRVDKVYPDHCGAKLEAGLAPYGAKLSLWMTARTAPAAGVDAAGTPAIREQLRRGASERKSPLADWLWEVAAPPGNPIRPGELVAIGGEERLVGRVAVVLGDLVCVVRLDSLRR